MTRWLRSVLSAGVLATVVWAAWRAVSGRLSIDGMSAVLDAHAWDARFVFMAMVVGAMFTHIPMAATIVIAIGAVVLGASVALVYGWAAALVGATGTFLLVRYVARDYVRPVLFGFSTRLHAFDDRLTRNGFVTVLGLRLVLGLAPLLDWGLGLTGVRTGDYFAATALGVVPNIAVAVFFADVITHRRAGSQTPFLILGFISVLVIAIAATLAVTRRRHHQ